MTYQEFVKDLIKQIESKLTSGTTVVPYPIPSDTGEIKHWSLAIQVPAKEVSPDIYLGSCYTAFKNGKKISQIADEFVGLFCLHPKDDIPHSFQGIKDCIVYKLINYNSNLELLKTTPHIRYLDLAIVFYILLESTSYRTITAQIHYEHLAYWGVSLEELLLCAKINTVKLLPARFENMESVIRELKKNNIPNCGKVDPEAPEMYVLTNVSKNHGATSILYNGLLKEIGDKLQRNYYILPSSTHEVIILPESPDMSTKYMQETIQEINAALVAPYDVLSDHPYYYNRQAEQLMIPQISN